MGMDFDKAIGQLETEWDLHGFFHRVRNGQFDAGKAPVILEILDSLDTSEEVQLPKRLVAVLWPLPMFLEWQTSRVAEQGGDLPAYEKFRQGVENRLWDILGVP
jgi:hypothetical protein